MNRTLALKLFVIGVVTGVILISLAMVNRTINDRQKYRDDAVKSIEASYAGPQTLIGPVLVRPYTQTTTSMADGEKGAKKRVELITALTATSFPHVLDVRGKLTPTQRQCLVLRAEGFRYAEIAEILRITIANVAQSLRRGLSKLMRDTHE